MGEAPDHAASPFRREDYAVPGLYLDCAARHPLPQPVVARLRDHAGFVGRQDQAQGLAAKHARIRAQFAALIGADADEIHLVPSTTAGERLILDALGAPSARRAVLTDELHFAGALRHYRALLAHGSSVTILPSRGAGIDYAEVAAALGRGGYALVALSSISHHNGFQHDLPGIVRLAHAREVPVYADLIQHAGALPIDVRASGVDFAACGTYKWLLGDMGLAFLYVRRERRQLVEHALARWLGTVEGADAVGGFASGAVEALLCSLPRTRAFVASAPREVWRPLLDRIGLAMRDTGLLPLSPADSQAPIRAFAGEAIVPATIDRLNARGVRVTGRAGYLRLSPGPFITPDQVDTAAKEIGAALRG